MTTQIQRTSSAHAWFVATVVVGTIVNLLIGTDQAFGVAFGMLTGYWMRGWFR